MLDAAYEAGLRGADDSDEEGSESSARAIWKAMHDAALASPVEGDRKDAEAKALATFTEYFVKNYPGPDTIIGRPEWHAPKIFRAALYAIDAAKDRHG